MMFSLNVCVTRCPFRYKELHIIARKKIEEMQRNAVLLLLQSKRDTKSWSFVHMNRDERNKYNMENKKFHIEKLNVSQFYEEKADAKSFLADGFQTLEAEKRQRLMEHGADSSMYDYQNADAIWLASVGEFCLKAGLSSQDFYKLYISSPHLRHTKTIQHLSELVDILIDFGYDRGPLLRTIIRRLFKRLITASTEEFRSVLEEDNLRFLKSNFPTGLKSCGYFPVKKLILQEQYKFISDYLADQIGIEQRVSQVMIRGTFYKQGNAFQAEKAGIKLLQQYGVSMKDIYENMGLVKNLTSKKLLQSLEEQKSIFGEVDLDELSKLFAPHSKMYTMTKILGKLFLSTYVTQEEREYFRTKMKLSVISVFYVLIDEGFQREEIRKYIYLLGYPESEVKQYLRDNYKTKDSNKKFSRAKHSLHKAQDLQNMEGYDSLHGKRNSHNMVGIGVMLKAKRSLWAQNEREQFLQQMQLAFEFKWTTTKNNL